MEIKNQVVETFEAKLASGNDLPGYVCVKIGASAKTITLGTGSTDAIIGITLPKNQHTVQDESRIMAGTQTRTHWWYESGKADKVSIITAGRCSAMVGTAGITLGQPVMCEALTGYVVDHSAGNTVVGFALETATSGQLAEILVTPFGVVTTGYDPILQVAALSVNGAIAKSTTAKGKKFNIITKGTACDLTLADPTATTDDYKEIVVECGTSFAHNITADFDGAGSATITFATKGDSITLYAYQGKWYIKDLRIQDSLQTLTGNGAITIKPGVVMLNKGSALAATLADPPVWANGFEMTIIAQTAQAHTVDNSAGSGFYGLGASYDIGTYGGAIGDKMVIKAIGTKWYVKSLTNVTLA